MAAIITVQAETSDVTRAIAVLKLKAKPAIARALNRTADNARTAIVRAIATDLGLKASAIREAVIIQRATADTLIATFRASATRIPLINFRAKGPEPSRGRGRGVTARLPGGAGRYPHAFITTVGGGRHRGVFERVLPSLRRSAGARSKNLPIRELRGPSIWQSFQKNQQVAVDRAREQLAKNIAHELQFALSKTA